MITSAILALVLPGLVRAQEQDPVATLAKEISGRGWIVYSARSENGTWDLFYSRPDGSHVRNLTNTPDFEEAAPRFSPDSTQLLFRRLLKGTKIDHDKWGFSGRLVVANPDASESKAVGEDGEFTWASWSPNGKEVVCLEKRGIRFVNLESGVTSKEMPRNGIYQQLFFSPDGQWLCGTGNVKSAAWNIVRMNAESGEVNPVHVFQSCTPDWFPDSKHMIYSSRPGNQSVNEGYGYTQLWMANSDGTGQQLVYGEEGVHIYGGEVSPDGAYVLFTKCPVDGGGSESDGAPMCIMRLADAPTIGGESIELRTQHPDAKNGPVIQIQRGWEPDWTYAEVGK
ncbi:MAG: hypothetical protein AMXMBFR84_41720 [Candidatus Hydrogenedentota bacterium]